MDLNEARRNVESCLGEELRKEYFQVLRQFLLFHSPLTKQDFDNEIYKILINETQIRAHKEFILALLSRKGPVKTKSARSSSDKGAFELADFVEYVQPLSPSMLPPIDIEHRSAAAELFVPDSNFVSARIAMTMWEYGLDGAGDDVTELIVHACQVMLKNIITAMISRKKGYKIRDGKLQYGFNLPVPNPFKGNYCNVVHDAQEMRADGEDADEAFIPKRKSLAENAAVQSSFVYSCVKKTNTDNLLTVRLLYETLKDNPNLLGSHELHSLSILKLGLQIFED